MMKKFLGLFNIKKWQKDTKVFFTVVLVCLLAVCVLSIFTPSEEKMRSMASPQMQQLLEEDASKEIKSVSVSYNSLFFINYISFSTSGNASIKEAYLGFAGQIFDATSANYKYLKQKNALHAIAVKNINTKEVEYLAYSEDENAQISQSEKIELPDQNAYKREYYANGNLVAYKISYRDTNTTESYAVNESGGFYKLDEDHTVEYTSSYSENVLVKDQYGNTIASANDGDEIVQQEDGTLVINGTEYANDKKNAAAVVGSLVNYTYRLLGCGQSVLYGAKLTIFLTITTVLCGFLLSIFLALGKISKYKIFSAPCSAYIFFFRGTPLMIQLFVIYFAVPGIFPGFTWSGLFSGVDATSKGAFLAAFIGFTLNSAAYCAEIVRAAIQSIDKGQHEAAKALGMTYGQTMRDIIIPQSIRRLIPPMANEFIMILKDASLVFVISLMDITTISKTISSKGDFLVFLPALIIYLIITAFFSFVFKKLENKFSVYE
jgi:amino ABC transporter, permease protein, 3-TM region, his/glu/gln/arg/opine family